MSQGARFQGLWDFLADFEAEECRNFWFGMRHKVAGFYHMLSVSVVPSVSVEIALESNDVLNDIFLRCVFERYDVKSQDHCSKKPPTASLSIAASPAWSRSSWRRSLGSPGAPWRSSVDLTML